MLSVSDVTDITLVNEYVFAIFSSYETKAFPGVKPFDGSFGHCLLLLILKVIDFGLFGQLVMSRTLEQRALMNARREISNSLIAPGTRISYEKYKN